MILHSSLIERKYKNIKTGNESNRLIEVFDKNSLSVDSLKWFFELGYIPGKQTLFENIEKIKKDVFFGNNTNKLINYDFNDKSYEEIVRQGNDKICESISELLKDDNKNIILPITAGLDSRIILGALLENVEAEKIISLTWGLPDGIDCSVGAKISKKIGIKHHLLDINRYELTKQRLTDFALASDFSVPLFDHWPRDWIKDLVNETNGKLWMGLLGGTISGSNLPISQAENNYSYFLDKNKRVNSLSSCSQSLLNTRPTIEDLNRVTKYIHKPSIDSLDIHLHHIDLISPTKLHHDLDYALPFADLNVISYFLSLPFQLRKGRGVFKDIILKHYPMLAKFSSNRNGGMPLNLKGKRRSLYKKLEILKIRNNNYNGSGKYKPLKYMIGSENTDYLLKNSLDKFSQRGFVSEVKMNQIEKEFFSTNKGFVDHSRIIDAVVSLEFFFDFLYDNN